MTGWRDNSETAGHILRGYLAQGRDDRSIHTVWGLEMIRRDPVGLAGGAGTNFTAYKYLTLGAAALLSQGLPLPPPIASYVAGLLIGHVKPPEEPRGPKGDVARDVAIYATVKTLVAMGARPQRKADGFEGSACDDVAVAAIKLGLGGPGYNGVVKIWHKYEKRRKASSAKLKP
jgi:hypothetical protein